MQKAIKSRDTSPYLIILALFFGIMLAASVSVWATTIGSDVDVSGTLTVTGGSTLTGAVTASGASTVTGALTANGDVTLGNAAADTITITGTPTFSAATSFNGNVTLGDAAADVVTFTSGDHRYSNAGTTTIPNSSAVSWAYATSSSAGGAFVRLDTSNVFVGVASSAPSATLDIGGDGSLSVTAATGTATSTIRLHSRGANRGGCLELELADGSGFAHLYATTTGVAVVLYSGSCR